MTMANDRCECGCVIECHMGGEAYALGFSTAPNPGKCMAHHSVEGSPFAKQCECKQYRPVNAGPVEDESPSGAEVVVQ